MRLIIVRHGETDGNIQNIFQGQGVDGLLSPNGIVQARSLAQRLRMEEIHIVYSSDLQRALHTGEEVLKFHPHLQLNISQELRERKLGVYEGFPRGQGNQYEKDSGASLLGFSFFKPEGGESYVELQKRIVEFYDDLLQKHPQQTVLLISHGGVATMLILFLVNQPITWANCKLNQLGNTGIAIFEIEGKKVTPILINDMSHLINI